MKPASLAALSLVLTMACGGDSTVRPPTTPTSTNPTLVSFSVQGPSTVPPGRTAQAKAVARFSDGSERDVTAEARWTATSNKVAIGAAGMLTGLALGRTTIRATYMFRDASLTIIVEPDGTFILRGNVTEPGNVAVEDAAVEVLSGPSSQVTTNYVGFYELFGVSGTFNLRVSKQGYVDETRTLTVTQDQTQDVQIRPRSQPAAVAGIYSVTLTASPSCSKLPAEAQTRTYTADVAQDVARLLITLRDASFVTDQHGLRNTFTGKVFGNTVTFSIGGGGYYYYYSFGGPGRVQELLSGGQTLGIWGTMTAPAIPQSISGTLTGGLTLNQGTRFIAACSASDNQVVFTRK
jgi:Carboxypeptidase regulatory-like domain